MASPGPKTASSPPIARRHRAGPDLEVLVLGGVEVLERRLRAGLVGGLDLEELAVDAWNESSAAAIVADGASPDRKTA